jgi:hypothetical protein
MKHHIVKLVMIGLQLASAGADFHYTNRNAHQVGFVEQDPLFRPFVTHSTAERATFFTAYASSAIAVAELLEHFHHPVLSFTLRAAQIEQNTSGAIFSATHSR